jgi:hypothetical protein
MTNHPEHELPTTAAIGFRDELLGKEWPDDRRVAELTRKAPRPGVATYADQARARGALLGVWSVPRHCFVYPDFQFNSSGDIRREVAELLAVLPSEDDHRGWRRTFWLYSPHALLDECAPAEIFIGDPTRVIAAARKEFLDDPAATW